MIGLIIVIIILKVGILALNGIHQNASYNYNTADHLRLVHIALLAWEISKDKKFIEWAHTYSREFAKNCPSRKNIPVAWNREWKEFFS